MGYEDENAQIAALEARIASLEAGSGGKSGGLTEGQVRQIASDLIGKLRINGPGVTGNPQSGWAINPVITGATGTFDCDADPPTIKIVING